jgi:hypothetical protein
MLYRKPGTDKAQRAMSGGVGGWFTWLTPWVNREP